MRIIEKCCVALLVVGGCTKTVSQCTQDSDCTTAVYPFCDVNGEYPASGGEHNVCTSVPVNCPVERCGCEPGAVSCVNDSVSTCASDGKSLISEACSLGCDTTNNRCFSFKASNGLDSAMTLAMSEAPVVLPGSVTIDTDACTMTDDATTGSVAVKSEVIAQIAAPSICVFVAGQFDISSVNAKGLNALGFVAPGKVTLRGHLDESAKARFQANLNAGPGSVTAGTCVGQFAGGGFNTAGGGGGNASAGGNGTESGFSIPLPVAGGTPLADFEPLYGGCEGGEAPFNGGGGGGALQISSLQSIELLDSGFMAFGGVGGGTAADGGGAGGTIVFEAPTVTIAGGVAANGGGGGANGSCAADGADATNDEVPAPGGVCNGTQGGAGGTRTSPPGAGLINGSGAGGGGAAGRILIRTADGTFTGPGTIFSVVKTLDQLRKI